MSRHSFGTVHNAGNTGFFPSRFNTLLAYALVVFFVRFGDAIMSYFSPIYIESVTNPMETGLIIASSSIFGISCDVLFSKWFGRKNYRFFLAWGITFALLFPLSFLLMPNHAISFLFAMMIWGVYYEMLSFSNFHFINHTMDKSRHDTGWSVLQTFSALAYMIAPLLASFLVGISFEITLMISFLFTLISVIGYQLFIHSKVVSVPKYDKPLTNQVKVNQFHLWLVLSKKLWPVLLFTLIIWMLDSVFWNAGSILAEELTENGVLGGLLFIAYLAPALFMGFIANRLSKYAGKKRTAYISGLLAGVFFIVSGMIHQPVVLFITIAIASTFIAVAVPEINGTIENYLDRLGHSANYLVGLQNAFTSMSYIIGPILTGVIATYYSYQFSFTVMGIFMCIVSIIALITTPRKIYLPQKEIHNLVS